MTTLPSGPEGTSETGTGGYDRAQASHLQRQVAEGFGTDAGRYDRARPTYPAGLMDRIIAASPGRDVLDVGCGTGISARLFQAAGCRVLGVDPDPRMAEQGRQGGTETEVAKFEDWDPAGRTFDAVIAAQAWHWVDPVRALPEVARVLTPGGRLGLVWNIRDEREDWVAQLGRTMHRHGEEADGDPAPAVGRPFAPLQRHDVEWGYHLSRAALVDLVASRSYVITLPEPQRTALLADVRELVNAHPALAGAGEIVVPYVTWCYRTDLVAA